MKPSSTNACGKNGVIVCFDTENFAYTTFANGLPFDATLALELAAKYGNLCACKSIGAIDALPEEFDRQAIREHLKLHGISHTDVQSLGKNVTDSHLIIETLSEVLDLRDEVGTLVFVSDDIDFQPLFLKVRSLRIKVIGIGSTRLRVSKRLTQACDIFLFHDELFATRTRRAMGSDAPPIASTTSSSNPMTDKDAEVKALVESIKSIYRDGKEPRGNILARRVRILFPNLLIRGGFKRYCKKLAASSGQVVVCDLYGLDFRVDLAPPVASPPCTVSGSLSR